MTVIAVRGGRDGSMAGDTQSTCDYISRADKIFRLRDGMLFGFAGRTSEGYDMYNWLQTDRTGPFPDTEETTGLLLDGMGKIWLTEGGWPPFPIRANIAAIGSGGIAAMVAMQSFGATPLQAVKATAKIMESVSGPFVSLKLRGGK